MTPETLARLTAQSPSLIMGVGGKAELTKAELAAVLCKVEDKARSTSMMWLTLRAMRGYSVRVAQRWSGTDGR